MSDLDGTPPRAPVVGFWDYTHVDEDDPSIVVVGTDGAGRLACATTPGDMLKHLQCPLGGPCLYGEAAR